MTKKIKISEKPKKYTRKVKHENGMTVIWKYDFNKFKDGLYEVEIID